jgi:uncharacterized oxidoreductase
MNTKNNTVLIVGGSAGIGLEIARLFAENGNQVIITGRDKNRLDEAVGQLKNTKGILNNFSKKEELELLVQTIKKDFPQTNIVINNAARAFVYDLNTVENLYELAEEEMQTNYLSIIRLNEKLLPHLKQQKQAAIVNVSSVVAIVPGSLTTYSASKAALHSYTQSLRLSLARNGNIKVFELMPPLVNTDFSQAIGGSKGIHPSRVAIDLLDAIENDIYEIRVGNTQIIYDLFLKSPAEALQVMNAAR